MGAASHIIDMLLGFSYIARLSHWGRNLLVQMKSTCLKEGEGGKHPVGGIFSWFKCSVILWAWDLISEDFKNVMVP